MSAEILDAVSRAVWVAGCCDDATYDEAVAAAKRGSPADASALLFNQEVAKAAISAMQSEISAERDAAVARAERAEARVAELETEVERLRAKYDDVISDRPYIMGWNAGYNFAEYGDEERDVPDVVSELAAKKQKEQQLAPAEWKAAIEANLTRLTAQARAQGMREAAGMIDPAIFDYPSVFMGGPSHRAKRIVEEIVAPILARADTIDGADNG